MVQCVRLYRCVLVAQGGLERGRHRHRHGQTHSHRYHRHRQTHRQRKARAHTRTGCPFPGCMYVVQVCACLQHMSGALPCLCVRVFSCRCRLHEVSSADSKPKVPHTLHSAICEAHVRTKQGPTTCLRACTQSCAYAAYSRALSEGVKRERLCHTRRTGRPRQVRLSCEAHVPWRPAGSLDRPGPGGQFVSVNSRQRPLRAPH